MTSDILIVVHLHTNPEVLKHTHGKVTWLELLEAFLGEDLLPIDTEHVVQEAGVGGQHSLLVPIWGYGKVIIERFNKILRGWFWKAEV